MKKLQIILTILLTSKIAISQNLDKIIRIKGDTLSVEIKSINEGSVTYNFPNETLQQTINKKSISKIIYGSGRLEEVTALVVITGEKDWEKVILTSNPADVEGLKKLEEVQGKQSRMYGGQKGLTEDAEKKVKKEAAKLKAHIVYITASNFAMTPVNNVLVKGVAYTY